MARLGFEKDLLVIVKSGALVPTSVLEDLGKLCQQKMPRYQGVRVSEQGPDLRATPGDESSKMLDMLQEAYPQEDVLALTNRALQTKEGRIISGVAHYATRSSLVHVNEDVYDWKYGMTDALYGLSLHELGHLQGLQHHVARTKDGYCPMVTGEDIVRRHGVAINTKMYFSTEFCTSCTSYLNKKSL